MSKNIDSYIAYGQIKIVELDPSLDIDIDKIKNLIENIRISGNNQDNNVLFSSLTDSESSVFEDMLKQIREGRNVNIYSSDSESYRGSDYFDKLETHPIYHGPSMTDAESDTNNNHPYNKSLLDPASGSYTPSDSSEEIEMPRKVLPRKVVITTTPAGDFPLPLPSWTDPRPVPSLDDTENRAIWERNVLTQKYWTSKYPLFDKEYKSIELNLTIDRWVDNVVSSGSGSSENELSPENIPLPPQDEHEVLQLTEEKYIKPENVSLPPVDKAEEEHFASQQWEDNNNI